MTNKKGDLDTLANYIYCLGRMEWKNYLLFEELANKVVFNDVKSNLLKLSQGNMKQSKLLIEFSNKLGTSMKDPHKCRMKLRPVCKVTESLIDLVKKKKEITTEELFNILLTLETQGGSTQFLYNQARTFLFMQKEISQLYGVKLEQFINKINDLAMQVEEHIELLEEIKNWIVQNTAKKNEEHHPAFRYQNPDSWANPKLNT